MAEKVVIENTSSDLRGAVLQNAASEATLQALLKAIQGLDIKNSGGGSANKSTNSVTKTMSIYEKTLKETTGTVEENKNEVKKSSSKIKDFGSALTDTAASITSAGLGLVFSGIVSAGKTVIGFFTDGLDALRDTSSVGASFNNDILELRRTAAAANMPLDEFTKMIKQNSSMLSQLGGTVTNGAKAFATLSSDLRTSDFGSRMMGMGLTMNDLNDYMGSYLEIQMRMGRLQGKTEKELREGTEAYIQEMETMTKITGLSRKDAEEKLRTAMQEGRLSFMASKLSGDALKNFQSGVLLVNTKLQPFSDSIKNAMAGIVKPGDKFAAMMSSAVPGFLSFNKALGQGKLSAKEQVQGYQAQAKALKQYLGKFSTEQIAANEELSKMQEYLNSINGIANSNVDAAAAEMDSRKKATELLGSLSQAFETLKNTLLSEILGSDTIGDFSKGFEEISGVLMDFAKELGHKIRYFMNLFKGVFDGAKEAGKSSFEAFTDGLSVVFDQIIIWLKPKMIELGKFLWGGISSVFSDLLPKREDGKVDWKGMFNSIMKIFLPTKEDGKVDWKSVFVSLFYILNDVVEVLYDIIESLAEELWDLTKSGFNSIIDSMSTWVSDIFTSIGSAFNGFLDYITPTRLIESVKSAFDFFSRGFSMFGNFITDLPLSIEKMIGKMDPTGMLVKTGVIRSAADIDKEMAKRQEERNKVSDTSTTTTPVVAANNKNTQQTTPSTPPVLATTPNNNLNQTPNAANVLPASQPNEVQQKQVLATEQLLKILDKLSPEAIAALSQNNSIIPQGAATTPNDQSQDQLNKTMAEMLEILKKQNEIQKDQVDAIKGRGLAMGPR
jgi:hypothetical protein